MTITFPPGPKDHSFGLSIMAQMKRDVLGAYLGLHREYGDAVSFRTGPYRMFMFFHPDQVREVLVTSAKSTVRFPRVMETFAQWNSRSVLIAEGEPWAQQRRLVQPVFQPRAMEGCSRVMVQSAQDVIASWTPELERSGYIDVDVDQTMTNLTLAIICRALFDADVSEQSVAIGRPSPSCRALRSMKCRRRFDCRHGSRLRRTCASARRSRHSMASCGSSSMIFISPAPAACWRG